MAWLHDGTDLYLSGAWPPPPPRHLGHLRPTPPERPSIDLDAFPEGERLLRALLHTSDLRPTSDALRQHPEDFEHLRRSYTFPREASAFHVYHAKADEVAPLTQLGFAEPSPEDSSAIA